jgi:hypothetical protein
MEQPVDKVLTMILFSVVKKGAAIVKKKDPLEIDIVDPLPDNLYSYEEGFLIAMIDRGADRKILLKEMMISLTKEVSKAIRGFSRKETIAYYKNIMKKAWQQIEAADTPDVQLEKFDEVFEWTMLDRKFEDRTLKVFRTRPVYLPMWWERYDPTYSPTPPAPIGSSRGGTGAGKSVSLPHLPGSDFAASVVSDIQGFSAGVIGNLSSFTSSIASKTRPVPRRSYSSRSSRRKSSSSSSSGGSSISCACACACAGCACACAGGGR